MTTAPSSSTYRGHGELGRTPARGSEFGNAARSALRQRPSSGPDYAAIHEDPDFIAIKRRLRLFIFPMGILVLGWFFTYVLLSDYESAFMSQRVFGSINMGLILGVLQFISTGAVTLLYLRYVRKHIDPRVDKVRERAGADQR